MCFYSLVYVFHVWFFVSQVALFKYASGGRWRARCLNGIQSTKMEEVRNGIAKDVLFKSGLKGYKSDKKIQEPPYRRVTRSKR